MDLFKNNKNLTYIFPLIISIFFNAFKIFLKFSYFLIKKNTQTNNYFYFLRLNPASNALKLDIKEIIIIKKHFSSIYKSES